MVIVFFGAPGVGKGTQAALTAERTHVPHLSTGEAFRQAIREGTAMGKAAKEYVESGRLVSDDIVTGIVREALMKPEYAAGCILDGFPRTFGQARSLDIMLQELGRAVGKVINIEVDNEEIVQRMLKRGRKDDAEDVIRDRLAIYNAETAPLLEYYSETGKLTTVDGNADVETVYQRIAHALE